MIKSTWIHLAIKSALFYGGWFYCVQSVVNCNQFQGALVIGIILIYLFIVSNHRLADLIMLITITLFGSITDTLYAYTGFIQYKCVHETLPWLAPYWLVSLWMLFATLIRESFAWLYGRWTLAIVLGSAGGVSSYLAAMRMGAASFLVSESTGIIILAIMWAMIVPVSIWYAKTLEQSLARN